MSFGPRETETAKEKNLNSPRGPRGLCSPGTSSVKPVPTTLCIGSVVPPHPNPGPNPTWTSACDLICKQGLCRSACPGVGGAPSSSRKGGGCRDTQRWGACDGCGGGSGGWKDQRQTPEARRQAEAGVHKGPCPHRASGLWPQNHQKMNSCCFKAIRFVVTSYNNPRKWIHS